MSISNNDVQSLIFQQSTFRECIINNKYNEATMLRSNNPITITFYQPTDYLHTTTSIFKIDFNKMWILEQGKFKFTFMDLNSVRSLCYQIISSYIQNFSCKSFIIKFNQNPILKWHFANDSTRNVDLRSNIEDLFDIYIGIIEMTE